MPVREKRQRRGLAPDLILGIVQVGEELNLRDRHKPVMAHANRQPQNRLLIQQRVDHPVRPEPLLQFLRDSIDAPLTAHIFAHADDLAMFQHQIGQRPVDQAAHGLGIIHRPHIPAKRLGARLGAGSVGGFAVAFGRDQAGHHLGGAAQMRTRGSLGSDAIGAGASILIYLQRLIR